MPGPFDFGDDDQADGDSAPAGVAFDQKYSIGIRRLLKFRSRYST